MTRFFKILILCFCVSLLNAQTIHRESYDIKYLVNSWVDANNTKDLQALLMLYDDKVLFYCENLSKEKCLEKNLKR